MNPVIRDIALQLGFPPYQVRKWKLRNAVPHKHRYPILAAAQKSGETLTFDDFDFAPAKRKSSPKRRRAA
jgi:hypothetical protein